MVYGPPGRWEPLGGFISAPFGFPISFLTPKGWGWVDRLDSKPMWSDEKVLILIEEVNKNYRGSMDRVKSCKITFQEKQRLIVLMQDRPLRWVLGLISVIWFPLLFWHKAIDPKPCHLWTRWISVSLPDQSLPSRELEPRLDLSNRALHIFDKDRD